MKETLEKLKFDLEKVNEELKICLYIILCMTLIW